LLSSAALGQDLAKFIVEEKWKVPVAGSKISALSVGAEEVVVVHPPANKIRPSGSRVADWPVRQIVIGPAVTVYAPVEGS
jgi:hypothetical protein